MVETNSVPKIRIIVEASSEDEAVPAFTLALDTVCSSLNSLNGKDFDHIAVTVLDKTVEVEVKPQSA